MSAKAAKALQIMTVELEGGIADEPLCNVVLDFKPLQFEKKQQISDFGGSLFYLLFQVLIFGP